MTDASLVREIEEFAETTNRALSTAAGQSRHVRVDRAPHSLSIRTLERGIILRAQGQPVMRLSVRYVCQWSQARRYMAIQKSSVSILPVAEEDLAPEELEDFTPTNEPLVRFDYEREPNSVPASHLNIHSHHPGLAWIMSRGHPKSRSARKAPQTDGLHFPTGGHRFRPCLEDIIEALVHDFGLDIAEDGHQILREQRQEFRQRQLAAAVGDDTECAAEALRKKGYEVGLKRDAAGPDRRGDRLQAL